MKQFDNYLYRGKRPESISSLKDDGFEDIINLQSGVFEFFHNDRYEFEYGYQSLGIISRKNFWLSDIFPPSVWTLKTIATILHQNNRDGIKTYIHCLHGKDRTGLIVAAYNILYRNYKIEDAIEKMYQNGFHKWPYLYLFNWPKQLRRLK